ncbi:MAG: glycoside hydrolase family 43 protein [Saprospiraceae bacterium]|nr:glycoside hydrolase family 43 protein [Saprospiraceae bacterium]
MTKISILILILAGITIYASGCVESGPSNKETDHSNNNLDSIPKNTFSNPLLPNGADPWAIFHQGNYYYIRSNARAITLMKTADITDLENAESKMIWQAPAEGDHSKNIWAPEIHNLNSNWYVYVAADDGDNRNHRMFVLENKAPDPFVGEFEIKAKIKTDSADNWAIDGSVFKHRESLYFIWSGWEIPKKEIETQNIYIARMSNPWTISSDRILLSTPEFEWERKWQYPGVWNPDAPVYVNEGPQALHHGNKLHIIYSASGCWTPYYSLGILTMDAAGDPMVKSSWTKTKKPIFTQSDENKVYGPGHNSFFKSPDNTEDWILYHANDHPTDGCANKRSPRAQKIDWTDDDFPNLGIPLSTSTRLKKPSGMRK